jgi:protein SCO1/2
MSMATDPGRAAPIRLRVAALAGFALLALGCTRTSPTGASLHPLYGLAPRLAFTLQDAVSGATVTATDFRDRVVMLYFGYTHCPDICPTTLAKLAAAVRELAPAERHRVRILFVTVDPTRDTLAVLRPYAAAFGPEVVGLRGTKAEIDRLAARYRVTYSFGKPNARGNYDVTHSSAVFIFGRDGRSAAVVEPSDGVAAIRMTLSRLASRA